MAWLIDAVPAMVGCANRATATLTRRFLGLAVGPEASSTIDDVLVEAAAEGARLAMLTSADTGAEAAVWSTESSALAATRTASEALVAGSMLRRRPTAFLALLGSDWMTSGLARIPALAISNGARVRRLALTLVACEEEATVPFHRSEVVMV